MLPRGPTGVDSSNVLLQLLQGDTPQRLVSPLLTKTRLVKVLNETTKTTSRLRFHTVEQAEKDAKLMKQSHEKLNSYTGRKRVLSEYLNEDCAQVVIEKLYQDTITI